MLATSTAEALLLSIPWKWLGFAFVGLFKTSSSEIKTSRHQAQKLWQLTLNYSNFSGFQYTAKFACLTKRGRPKQAILFCRFLFLSVSKPSQFSTICECLSQAFPLHYRHATSDVFARVFLLLANFSFLSAIANQTTHLFVVGIFRKIFRVLLAWQSLSDTKDCSQSKLNSV